jgi:para-aminobenzoate synthetase component 1
LHRERLPYRPDSAELFAPLAGEPWAMWLDSGAGGRGGGRWDILCAGPERTLTTRGAVTEVRSRHRRLRSCADPLGLLRGQLGPIRSYTNTEGLPFVGGAVGWIGYDLARRIERLGLSSRLGPLLPELAVGIYDWALLVDHAEQTTWLVGQGRTDDPVRERLRALALRPRPAPSGTFRVIGEPVSNLDWSGYARRFDQVQAYIEAGDCYQVNLARRWSVPAVGDGWRAYLRLREINPAPYSACIQVPGVRILCASPERFLSVRHGRVETRPIKGTRPRASDPARDQALADELRASPKDRAENLMIVDLLRNDLGRGCQIGSITVPRLFGVESFAGLHHLVSTVSGRLTPGSDPIALLRGCLPGGSITGAPKIRAMQIIDALEGEARGVYCGNLFYLGRDGAMDSNIVIRTLSLAGGELRWHAGGGLVADSRCDAEWDEIAVKAQAMHRLVAEFS